MSGKRKVEENVEDSANKQPKVDSKGETENIVEKGDENGSTNSPLPSADDDNEKGSRIEIESTGGSEDDEKLTTSSGDGGTVLICGGTNWDMTGRKTPAKGTKGTTGKNLWLPHRFTPLSGVKVRLVASGCVSTHSIIVTEEGQAMSFGRNEKGQLGVGDVNRRDVPTVIDALKSHNVVAAACGRNHTLFLTVDTSLNFTGNGIRKEFQKCTWEDAQFFNFQENCPGLPPTNRGTAFSCGENKMGQCGHGNQHPIVHTATQLNYKGPPIVKVGCGAEFSVILDCKGVLHSFGCPEYGQLGHNTDGKYFVTSTKLGYHCETTPKRIVFYVEKAKDGHVIPVEVVEIIDFSCGSNHTVAIDIKKRVFSWGWGGLGRLGHAEQKDELIPRLIKFFDSQSRGVKAVHCGNSYSLAINELGAVYLFGQTKRTGEANMYPKPIQDLTGWAVRSVGCGFTSIVMAADDSVIAWGPSPTYGELGLGEHRKSTTTPMEVKALEGIYIQQVACGMGHTLFLARDQSEQDKAKLEKLPEYTP